MRNNKRKGFTLVELLVVIAILAILATVSVVGYTSFIKSAYISNDENIAAQLNQFMVALKADSDGDFYDELQASGGKVTVDNVREITDYILNDSGLATLIPQAADYGYHFYFDLENQEYVLLSDEEATGNVSGAMHFMNRVYGLVNIELDSFIPEICFTSGGRYFLVETGTDLYNVVNGFYTLTTSEGLSNLYDAAQALGEHYEKLVALIEQSVFATSEGYLVVADTEHKALFVPKTFADGTKLSGVKINVLDSDADPIAISSTNPLITLGENSVYKIPAPHTIYSNALWFSGDNHYTPDENNNYKTTLKFDLTLDELKEIVDINFTNVVFEVADGDGKQYGYIDGAIVCLTDGTVVGEITTKLKVTSFTIGIQNINSEGKYSVALDKAETTYQMVATNFKSDDPHNPDNVPDTTVTWSLVEAPAGVSISESGVISGLAKGTIKVRASSNRTPATTADYEIRVGIIDDVTIDCTFNGETNQIAFDSNNESDTITHAFGTNNVYQFTAAHSTTLDDVTNYDTSCTWAVSDPDLAEITADGKLTIKKAGSFSVTFKYNKYESVERTINFVVTNKVTSFEIGIKDIDTVDPIYSLDLSKSSASYEMIIKSVGTDDGGNSLGNKTVTWSVLGDGISNDGNKVSFTKSGEFTVKATIDGITETFTFRVGGLTGIVVQYKNNGTTYTPAFGNDNATDTIPHSLGNNDTYEFVLTPAYNFGEAMPTLTPKYEISDETKATISGNTLTIKDAGAFSVTIYYVEYPETKYVVNFNSVASDVFNYENKDAFNFRYGTSNAGTILLKDGIDASKYTFELDTSNFNNQGTTDRAMTYTITDGVVKATFVGGGKAEIVAKYDGTEVDRVAIEIVTGAKNIHTSSDIHNGSMCLMGDVTSDKSMSIGTNQGLYGNGYTLTATEKVFYNKNTTFISLSGTLENVNVVGMVVDGFYLHSDIISGDDTTSGNDDDKDNYKVSATVAISNGALINNSMISNGKFAIRVYNKSGEFTIENSVISGGIFGLMIESCSNLTVNLENITIAQLRTQDMLGIGFYSDVAAVAGQTNNININITGDNNKLQSFVSYDDISLLPSDYQSIFISIWNDSSSSNYKYTCTYDGKEDTFMNIGFTAKGVMPTINYSKSNLNNRLTDVTKTIAGQSVIMLGYDKEKDTDNYVSSNLLSWLETVEHSYASYAEIRPVFSNVPSVSMSQMLPSVSGSITLTDSDILENFTAVKYGKNLEITYLVEKIEGEGTFNGLTFTGAAKYKITYTVTDNFDINEVGEGKKYSFEIELFINTPEVVAPELNISAGTKAPVLSTSGMSNPSNVTITCPDTYAGIFMVEAEYKTDYGTEYDTEGYYFNLEYLTITATSGGTAIPTENIKFGVGANLSAEQCTIAYGTKHKIKAGEDKPANLEDKSKRWIVATDITISVEYQGLSTQKTIRVVHWVDAKTWASCVTPDTLVTLADGTQKEIQYVTYEDELLVWNHFTGNYDVVPAAIIFNHGYDYNTVIKLNFSDGTQVKMINLHQFFDADLNKYVSIDAESVEDYVGHNFVKQNGDSYTTVTLDSYEISEEYIEAYGIISALHYNIFVEGMLSTDFMPQDYDLFNYFAFGEGLKFDAELMQSDIEKYGLYTYEDFADHLTYEQFVGFNVQYFKIAVGKGLYTYEGILDLIATYLGE